VPGPAPSYDETTPTLLVAPRSVRLGYLAAVTENDLRVAVTGPTGTFGFGLMPLLQRDDRIREVVGIARRRFEPTDHGWSKMVYRRGDVRDQAALAEAFDGADVVVHLAFIVVGGDPATTREVNVEGTLAAYRAARDAGAARFVYASSVAAYGFHRDNPVGIPEDWPVRPAEVLFYAQEKAELEELLAAEADAGGPDLYLLRPPIVLGPHAVGAKATLPAALQPAARRLLALARRLPLFAVAPAVGLQVIHEDDVGRALLQCVVAAGPPGAYNIAADEVVTLADVARELGFVTLPLPERPARSAARLASKLPGLPQPAQWVEALSHPAIMDTTRAHTELGWAPEVSALEAIRSSLPAGGT
jgi:nucleoside-diphosphate-sugar epimerase